MKFFRLGLFFLFLATALGAKSYDVSQYGGQPDEKSNTALALKAILAEIRQNGDTNVLILFPKGEYHFYREEDLAREYYISNHDQTNPKYLGIPIEKMKNLTLDGNGSLFLFHGRMLPFSIVDSENVTLKNLAIDFVDPKICQITKLDPPEKNHFSIDPACKYDAASSYLKIQGEGYKIVPQSCIIFDKTTNQIYPQTSDVLGAFFLFSGKMIDKNIIKLSDPQFVKYPANTALALRSWDRPTPGIFVADSKKIALDKVKIHHAEGMGLLAQMSEDITLNYFQVALREGVDRCFTTQADATHFSGCKGVIVSKNGLYEGMMDDAINVHGTYLKITQINAKQSSVVASYQHPQAWGFRWGEVGDEVQFIKPFTMELLEGNNQIASIRPLDGQVNRGAKSFEIVFKEKLPRGLSLGCGIENLTWTPEVIFTNNEIRNNRARGALFSTPKKTVCEDNYFHNISGTAILLCGDCNGWYETGACKEVYIRNNRFENNLTSLFQFTNAIISIYPEIPFLLGQKKYFHSGIVIENNEFVLFDRPILYAKSTDGLRFKGNKMVAGTAYAPFHPNKKSFLFDRCKNIEIVENQFGDYPFSPLRDIKVNYGFRSDIHFSE